MAPTRRSVVAGVLAIVPATALAVSEPGRFADVTCVRRDVGNVQLQWTTRPAHLVTAIQSSTDPDGPFSTHLGASRDGAWTGAALVRPRPYFQLSTAEASMETAERVLPLEGGRNFRDLGGYRSRDGRYVRWGRLYRSGAMAGLTEADYSYLADLKIAVICDLRSARERVAEPTRWPGPNAPAVLARDYDLDESALKSALQTGTPTAAGIRAAMIEQYASFPYYFAEDYKRMFAELVEGRLPLAVNCSAGKDRTGVAAALILTALDVDRQEILADYSLSEKVVNFEHVATRPGAAHAATGFEFIQQLPPDVRAPLMRSDPAYLQTAFAAMERRDGSVRNFLSAHLGVGPRDIARLQNLLLKAA